jgi:hypothetical protein
MDEPGLNQDTNISLANKYHEFNMIKYKTFLSKSQFFFLSTTLELERAALTFVRYLDFEPKIQTPMT